jgi:hypothetical protein
MNAAIKYLLFFALVAQMLAAHAAPQLPAGSLSLAFHQTAVPTAECDSESKVHSTEISFCSATLVVNSTSSLWLPVISPGEGLVRGPGLNGIGPRGPPV